MADFALIQESTLYRDLNLSYFYIGQELFDRAKIMIEKIIRWDPSQFNMHAVNLASAYLGVGDVDKAAVILNRILAGKDGTNKAAANYSLGIITQKK